MNMLEKVTQAMCPMNEPRCSKCRRKAKAAINALMEPTDEMVEQGRLATKECVDAGMKDEPEVVCFVEMLREALKE